MHRDSLAAIPQIHSFLNFLIVLSLQGHPLCMHSPTLHVSYPFHPHSDAVGQRREQQLTSSLVPHAIPGL